MEDITRQSKKTSVENETGDDQSATSVVLKAKRKRRSQPRDAPPQRSSVHRGVTRHRWTGRYEAHLWDKNSWNETQTKKGRQGQSIHTHISIYLYELLKILSF
ncbi:hypothetical protein AXX17_AT1G16830 [Arabidopsis thaliana]|uniref:Uncharacterized protein n=1 Tax=Arabidopsis thaliana TaxID=3702 RepID=A0A178WRK4_ARATH|nr:hypothetical protein AXX17_AT1G16830 [Arabidopsis thaliana]